MCDCTDDEGEYSRYQPVYVEAYMDNRAFRGQTIQEWTEDEGKYHFTSSDIYAPVTVAVAISGTENNGFSIDLTKPDWHNRFHAAVKQTLVDAGLARVGDVVGLEDVRSAPIADKSLQELMQTAVVYATVNGKRTKGSKPTEPLGCAVPTPVTHSASKESKLVEYVGDLCGRAKEMFIRNLASEEVCLFVFVC
jgi:hypothetical protein